MESMDWNSRLRERMRQFVYAEAGEVVVAASSEASGSQGSSLARNNARRFAWLVV